MKKYKVFPAVLMMILCVAIVGVGIYAVSPSKNSVAGFINIESGDYPVLIQTWVEKEDGTQSNLQSKEVRTGNVEFSFDDFVMDQSATYNLEEIPEYNIKIKITNLSNYELGAYIFKASDNVLMPPEVVEYDNIMKEDLLAGVVGVTVNAAYVRLGQYVEEPEGVNNDKTDEATITINFKAIKWAKQNVASGFIYDLVVEQYQQSIANLF